MKKVRKSVKIFAVWWKLMLMPLVLAAPSQSNDFTYPDAAVEASQANPTVEKSVTGYFRKSA